MAEGIPTSIQLAMEGIDVEGLVCLEAGTGAGNMTCYLVARGARLVYSLSDNQEHLDYARERLSGDDAKRVEFIRGDLRKLDFLSGGTIDVVTAHMLINVLPSVDLFSVLGELSRVAKQGALLVVNDYNPLSSHRGRRSHLVERLLRIENAVCCLVEGEPALVWYPSHYVAELLRLRDWEVESVTLLYDKTPWHKELLRGHVDGVREASLGIEDEGVREGLLRQTLGVFDQVADAEVIYAGSIYSIKARRR